MNRCLCWTFDGHQARREFVLLVVTLDRREQNNLLGYVMMGKGEVLDCGYIKYSFAGWTIHNMVKNARTFSSSPSVTASTCHIFFMHKQVQTIQRRGNSLCLINLRLSVLDSVGCMCSVGMCLIVTLIHFLYGHQNRVQSS